MTESYDAATGIREAIIAAADRLEAQLALLVAATERLATAVERQADLAERVTGEKPPPA
jgi:hypothetical protein